MKKASNSESTAYTSVPLFTMPATLPEAHGLILALQARQIELQQQISNLQSESQKEKLTCAKYAELYDFSPSGSLTLSIDGTIIGLNSFAVQMLGKDSVSLVRRLFSAFVAEEKRLSYEQFLQRVFTSEAKESCEIILACEGKSPRNVIVEGIISLTENQCLLTLIDISEQKQTLEALRESEGQFRFIFANNPQPMLIYDSQTLKFLEVNHASVAYYGYSREEFLSMTIKEISLKMENDANSIDLMDSNLKVGTDIIHLKKNGQQVVVSLSSCGVIFNGYAAVHVIVNDITEQKRLELALSKSELIVANETH